MEVVVDITFEQAVFGDQIPVDAALAAALRRVQRHRAPARAPSRSRAPSATAPGQVRRVRQSVLGQMVSSQPVPALRRARRGDHHAVPEVPRRGSDHRRQDLHGRRAGRRRRRLDAAPHPARCGRATRRRCRRPVRPPPGAPARPLPPRSTTTSSPTSRSRSPRRRSARRSTLPTLDGDEELVVQAGTQPGHEFVLRGRGVPRLHGRGRGDLRAIVRVEVPDQAQRREPTCCASSPRGAASRSREGGGPVLEDQVGVLVIDAAALRVVRCRRTCLVDRRRRSPALDDDDRPPPLPGAPRARRRAVTVTDGHGGGELLPCGRRRRRAATGHVARGRARIGRPSTVAFAIPKADRPEWIVQKLTELGVDRIVVPPRRALGRALGGRPGRAAPRQAAPGGRRGAEAVARVWLPEIVGPVPADRRAARRSPSPNRAAVRSPAGDDGCRDRAGGWMVRRRAGAGPSIGSRSATPCCGSRRRRWSPVPLSWRRSAADPTGCASSWSFAHAPKSARLTPDHDRWAGYEGEAYELAMTTTTTMPATACRSASVCGRSASRSGCRCTTSRRNLTRSSRRRCSAPTNAVSAALSLPRLDRLAQFYRVPVDQLLPRGPTTRARGRRAPAPRPKLAIDILKLTQLSGAPFEMLTRFLRMIQVQRQDFNGRVLTIRQDDKRAIAAMLDIPVDQVALRLEALDLVFRPSLSWFTGGYVRRTSSRSGCMSTSRSAASKCDYCAFATWTDRHHLTDAYVDAARERHPAVPSTTGCRPATSVFVGGGTPSMRPGRPSSARCSRAIPVAGRRRDHGRVQSRRRDRRAAAARTSTAGVNRVSLGVQSMAAHVLGSLGRTPRPAQRRARQWPPSGTAGMPTFNLDLIYGAAGESLADWQHDRRVRARPRPTARVGVRAHDRGRHAARRRSPIAIPTTTTRPTSTSSSTRCSRRAGLENYEISNWARPGHECRHNLLYWRQQDYRGFGCAAHSHRGRAALVERAHARPLHRARRAGEADRGGRARRSTTTTRRFEGLELALRMRDGVPARRPRRRASSTAWSLVGDGERPDRPGARPASAPPDGRTRRQPPSAASTAGEQLGEDLGDLGGQVVAVACRSRPWTLRAVPPALGVVGGRRAVERQRHDLGVPRGIEEVRERQPARARSGCGRGAACSVAALGQPVEHVADVAHEHAGLGGHVDPARRACAPAARRGRPGRAA